MPEVAVVFELLPEVFTQLVFTGSAMAWHGSSLGGGATIHKRPFIELFVLSRWIRMK